MGLSLVGLHADEFGDWLTALRARFAVLLPAGSPGRVNAADVDAAIARELPDGFATVGADILWVRDADRRVGYVWLSSGADGATVRDVVLDDPDDAPAVLDLVVGRVRPEALVLNAWWVEGDPSQTAFVGAGAFEVSATNLALTFTDTQPEVALSLRPMTPTECAAWLATEVEQYAAERARNGEAVEVARRTAERQTAEMLPDGAATPGHAIWVGEVDGTRVGVLWIDLRHSYAFVYSIAVDAAMRGRGHGRTLMQAGAHAAQQHGAIGVALNVFGDNVAARRLYDSLGYRPTQGSVRMPL